MANTRKQSLASMMSLGSETHFIHGVSGAHRSSERGNADVLRSHGPKQTTLVSVNPTSDLHNRTMYRQRRSALGPVRLAG